MAANLSDPEPAGVSAATPPQLEAGPRGRRASVHQQTGCTGCPASQLTKQEGDPGGRERGPRIPKHLVVVSVHEASQDAAQRSQHRSGSPVSMHKPADTRVRMTTPQEGVCAVLVEEPGV